MRTAAAALVALLGLAGTAQAQLDVGAVDFKEDYAKVAEANPDVGRLNVSWLGIDNTVRRIDSPRRRCDDGGLYNWCSMDEQLRRYAFTGTPVHLVLVGVPAWAERPGCDVRSTFSDGRTVHACSPAPQHLDEWSAFVSAAVRRYGPEGRYWDATGVRADTFDVLGWEVWNEPNLASFWNGYQREPGETRQRFVGRMVSQYVELLDETDAAIESVNSPAPESPHALTVGPSASVEGDTLWEEEFAARPAAAKLDRVSVHPYDDTVEGALADVARMRELLPGTPMWITEHGWGAGPVSKRANVGGVAEQSAYLHRFLDALRADHPYVARYVYFNGIDNETDPAPAAAGVFDEMGLFEDGGAPKPVLAAFQSHARPAREALARAASAAVALAAALGGSDG
jgi:hypothetical protein